MNLDLKSVQYAVFDEADRLFEMGFETAMTEILHRLPASRQTLLFSATLPKSLVEFAKAGLQNPKLVRLDAEGKISTDLRMAFFSVKQAEKDACLLILLRDVIGVPLGGPKKPEIDENSEKRGKGKSKAKYSDYVTAPHQTLIFAATKHHVEYLMNMLTTAGYAVSHIYGSLDQVARSQQMEHFRKGYTNILVVTDVAARGIDIPVLENVVNYDFPQGARVFVHRVGRTARAGRQGWAWSFVTNTELPYLLDLQLFLGRPINSEVSKDGDQPYTESLILGPFDRDRLDEEAEYVKKLDEENHNLAALREVMRKGHSMYERSKGKASQASYNRAKKMMKEGKSGLVGASSTPHPVLLRGNDGGSIVKKLEEEKRRKELLMVVNSFRPSETVLEIGARGNAETAALMKQRRKALSKAAQRAQAASTSAAAVEDEDKESDAGAEAGVEVEMADEEEIAVCVTVFCWQGPRLIHSRRLCSSTKPRARVRKGAIVIRSTTCHTTRRTPTPRKGKIISEMSWLYQCLILTRYSLHDGATFAEQARGVTFDLTGDEALQARKRRELRWDKTKKKFVKGAGEGADNVKLVKTESGIKLPATYRSGRFDEWKAKSRVSIPRIGETEGQSAPRRGAAGAGGRKYRHNQVAEAKPLDKLHKSYEKKIHQQKKKQADGAVDSGSTHAGNGKKKLGGRFGGKPVGKVKNELKTVDQIRKSRAMSEKKKAKNARPTNKGKRGRR